MPPRLFVSATSDDYEQLRLDLAEWLRKADYTVKHQAELVSTGENTLTKLAETIRIEIEVVLHIVGSGAGQVPPLNQAEGLLEHFGRESLRQRFPELIENDAYRRVTYTQWEAWLGLIHGKRILPFMNEDAKGQSDNAGESPMSSVEHWRLVKNYCGYPDKFSARADLPTVVLTALSRLRNRDTRIHETGQLDLQICRESNTCGTRDTESALPDEFKQLIAAAGDLTFRPEVFSNILIKMRQDFKRGALWGPKVLSRTHEQATNDLAPIADHDDTSRITNLNISAISNLSWGGIPNRNAIRVLRDAVEMLGRPLIVSCSSINVAAYTVLKGLRRHGIRIQVFPDDASGREQASTIAANPRFDFVVCADAPMFLDRHVNVRLYSKIFEVYHEEQFLLRKRGLAKGNPPTLHVYETSTAQQQLLLAPKAPKRFQLPQKFKEEPLLNMADFKQVSKLMNPGDMVFAWGALAQSLMRHQSLIKVKSSDFALTVSVFRHPAWLGRINESNAFLDVFVAEWNYCADHEKLAFKRLIKDRPFMNSFVRGGGFTTVPTVRSSPPGMATRRGTTASI